MRERPTPVSNEVNAGRFTDVILDSVADGVFTVDGEWRITSFNRAAERITGVPRADAIGKPCWEVFRASICETHCALRHTLDTGREVVSQPVFIIDTQGRRVPISVSTAVLRDASGAALGGVETFRDLSEVEELRRRLEGSYTCEDMVGRSAAMRRLFDLVPVIAASDSTVLIEGASGTGKELVARAIHAQSRRRRRPFVAVNCGALPDTLLESELFGYKAGAFTDARRDKPGRFALADGGTLLLDEIGDISTAMQAKLLRVLQEHAFEPLGSVHPVKSDVRVIAATNRDLEQLLRDGTFRQDLFYRLNVIRLKLPDLRERREDIPLLVDHFLAKFNTLRHRSIEGVSAAAMACLMSHDFPGNVRELENAIEHACVLCAGSVIDLEHLPPALAGTTPECPLCGGSRASLRQLEASVLSELLRRQHGNRAAAARELGVHPATVFRKIKALGIQPPRYHARRDRR
jgi:PAS domain S-box-containing protein